MQHVFNGFKATRPVARLYDLGKHYYEVFFLVYVGKEKISKRYKEGINHQRTKGDRKRTAEVLADILWEGLTSGWNPLKQKYPEGETDIRQNRRLSFIEALDLCYTEKIKTLEKGSVYNYKHTYKSIRKTAIKSGYGEKKVGDIERKDIRAIVAEAKEDFDWTAKARNQYLGILKSILTVLVDKDILQVNPAHKIKLEKQSERTSYKRITETERNRISEYLSKYAPAFLDFLYCIYDTGVRPKELHLIQLFDIRLTRREIVVRAEVAKTDKERIIPITDDMLAMLIGRDINSLPRGWYLFSRDKFLPGPKPYGSSAGRRWWKKYVQGILGIDAKLYGLKHTGGDAKLLAGIDTRTLKSLYGHSSEQMTEKYLEELQEIHKQKIIANAPSFSAKIIPLKKAK